MLKKIMLMLLVLFVGISVHGASNSPNLDYDLHDAACKNDLAWVKKLVLEKKANVNGTCMPGWVTPLQNVVARPNPFASERKAVLEFLVAQGALVNIYDNLGWTPLHWAALCGGVEIVRLLLNAGALINAPDKNGYNNTPLHVATNPEVRALLIDRGADIIIKNAQGRMALEGRVWPVDKN
ncbi:ankyrin repeat domain-containing protein [Candidatus Babeliales bacterium]|nr:ankyrin repeat domain-containing protein [Candidatus Babeliales bacterium]